MSEAQGGMIMGAAVLTLVTIIIVTVIIQFSAMWRAKARLAREDEFRKLAEQAVAARASAAVTEQSLVESLSDIRLRLAAIEKLLREVA